ncbi:MAG: DUF6531 domain-containing protein [Phycisphaerales bacterium]
MFKHLPCRFVPATLLACVGIAAQYSHAGDVPTANVRNVIIQDVSYGTSEPAAAQFDRNELTIVVTRHAWNLEVAGPSGNQHVVIEAGHDSGVTCSDTALQAHLRVPNTPTGTDVQIWSGDFDFESDSSSSPVYHQTTSWSTSSSSGTFGGLVTISAVPDEDELGWSDLGTGQTFRVDAATDDASVSSYTYSLTTEVVSNGIYGADVYTIVESNGVRTEYLTETIVVMGMEGTGGADADTITPDATEDLGCCTFPCGEVTNVTESECDRYEGTSWESSSTCTGTPTTNFCGGGTIPDPNGRDDAVDVDGEVDPLDQYCGGGDEPGSGAPTYVYNGLESVAPAPIEQTTGQKIETATDLVVDLSGTDFRLTRRYRSVTNSANTLLGNAWTMGLFSYIDVGTGSNPDLVLKAPQGFATFTESSGVWSTGGPTDQTIKKQRSEITGGYAVWRLYTPGGSQMDFHRIADGTFSNLDPNPPSSALEGLPYRHFDHMGNRWSFEYTFIGGEPRLTTIIFERFDSAGSYEAEAKVNLLWHNENAEAGVLGRLRSVTASRPDSSLTSGWYTTHRVQYQYVDDLLSDGNTLADLSYLGTTGDLIQVTTSERLDDNGTTEVYRDRITQYRYHDGTAFDIDDMSPSEGQGEEHHLKMVINPFEVEYFAQNHRGPNNKIFSLGAAAQRLHKLRSHETAFSVATLNDGGGTVNTPVVVARLASKIIADYDSSNRVVVQYLQASCGCGGNAIGTLGVRREYAYDAQTDGTTNLEYFYFEITESSDTDNNGSFEDYRIYRTHHRTQSAGGVPRLYIESIEDADTAATTWAKAYDYTTDGELKAVINTSAISSYDPIGESNPSSPAAAINLGSYTPNGSSGYVMGYEYDANSRVEAVYFRAGYDDTVAFTDLSWETLETFERNANRPDLISEHVRWQRAETSTYTPGNDDKEVTTFDYSFWDPNSGAGLGGEFEGLIIAYKKTSVERELTDKNGPGPGTYDTKTFYDVNGRMVLQEAPDGSVTEYEYSGDTEYLTKVIRNQNSVGWTAPGSGYTIVGGSFTVPTSGRSDGGSLTTEYVRDKMGRVIEVIAPGGITTYTYRTMSNPPSRDDNTQLLYYSEITLPHPISESGSNYDAFASTAAQQWFDASGLTVEDRSYELSTAAKSDYRENARTHISNGTIATRATMNIDWASKSIEQRVWQDASDDDAHYLSQAQFDEYGRTLWNKDAVGTFTEYAYDVMDRVTSVSVGTNRSVGSNNMVVVATNYYDGSTSSMTYTGDSNLTQVIRPIDGNSTNDRITSMYYDDRNRVVFKENPLPPHSYTKYDNLNRPTEQHQVSELTYSDTSSLTQTDLTKRVRSTYPKYSQRGLVYETGIEIDPTAGPHSDLLVNHSWFDEVGRVIKSQPHSGPGTKIAFDGLGRSVHRFMGDMTGDGSSFTNVYNTTSHKPVVTGDIILQETATEYIEFDTTPMADQTRGLGQPELVTNYERAHDASSTGSLSNFDGTGVDATAVATFSVMLYDEASRPVKNGFYGTNDSSGYFAGGTAPTPPTNEFSLDPIDSVPAMPGTALTSETVYDDRGRAHVSIAPDGTRSRTIFDDLNRTLATIENDQSGSVVTLSWDSVNSRWSTTNAGSSTSSQNRVTSFVYDDVNNLIKRVAHVDDSNVQETEYDYSYNGTLVDSNSLLSSVHYPNEGSGAASTAAEYTVNYEYNRQGDMTKMTDQNGTVHEYVHDALGRVTLDKVTTFGYTDLDDTVQAIQTLYSSSTGLVEYVTSYDGTDPATDTVLNQIKYEYDSLLELSKYHQNPTGDVSTGAQRARSSTSTIARPPAAATTAGSTRSSTPSSTPAASSARRSRSTTARPPSRRTSITGSHAPAASTGPSR